MAGPARDAGYVIERERGALVVALPSVMAEVSSLVRDHGTLYAAAAAQPDAQSFTGRGAAYRMSLAGEDCVVRHYRRGGAVARVLHDEYVRAGEPRPLRELHASIAARSRGVDTPEVTAAIAYLAGPLYRADLATRYVNASRDLAAVTFGPAAFAAGGAERQVVGDAEDDVVGDAKHEGAGRAENESVRSAAWYAAGALLRAAFAAGVEHADLNLRNILIAGGADQPRALLLDLDRATVRDRAVSDATRSAMLARLHRSRSKFERRTGMKTGEAELAAFEAGLRGRA